ncbi:unnamed protein product [Larinioides sclopetarius]|uniref:Uncharacterized protein n=1 Tax=Larinioides sclopetarius TaxID=280406 RepID=A0AAV2AS44_9ARAC
MNENNLNVVYQQYFSKKEADQTFEELEREIEYFPSEMRLQLLCSIKDIQSQGKNTLDGQDKIGSHRDNETDMDPNSSIVTFSFGAERTMIFKRPNFNSVKIPLKKW